MTAGLSFHYRRILRHLSSRVRRNQNFEKAVRFREQHSDVINGRNDFPVPPVGCPLQPNKSYTGGHEHFCIAGRPSHTGIPWEAGDEVDIQILDCRSLWPYQVSFTWITLFLLTRYSRAILCGTRSSMQSGTWANRLFSTEWFVSALQTMWWYSW